tara:strand:+ start:6240 stop:6827 length:588 start_codon:yes stop_codon:yes gene_type:complete
MTRAVPNSILTALSNSEIEPFYAVDLAFQSGALRLWTGYGNKTINSATYTGTGTLLKIDGLEEAGDLSARGTTLTLSGLASTVLTYALTEEYQGRLVTIYWGLAGVADVVEVFSGYMDQMIIVDEGDTSTVKLKVESRLITLERPNIRRYTSESHKAVRTSKGLSGSDSFFDWVSGLQDKSIVWGREVQSGDETT